ncbi:MAG: hypothetical protein NTX38_11950 [Methylobacter sp.]|nr:hypothetical protein [Methylobacter sp.]
MSFFSKTTIQDKWKDKYLNLLDEQDYLKTAYQEKEDLLCKTIVRLTFATIGFDAALDPHLLCIRNQLKKGINSPELKESLEILTQSVAQIKHSPNQAQTVATELLFDFLLQQYKSHKQQAALHLLKNSIESSKTEFQPNQLFSSIVTAIETETKASPTNILTRHIDIGIISQHLLLFLEQIEIPSIFDQQAQAAKQLLNAFYHTLRNNLPHWMLA